MVAGEYPPRWGGLGTTAHHLAIELTRLGHRVTILTRSGTVPVECDGIHVRELGWARLPMAFTTSFGKAAAKDLVALNETDPVDVIHAHLPIVAWSKRTICQLKSIVAPIVASMHGTWLGERDGLRRAVRYREPAALRNPNDLAILFTAGYYARYERAALSHASICVANSEATAVDLRSRYNAKQECDLRVVLWGVDTRAYRPLSSSDEDTISGVRTMHGVEHTPLASGGGGPPLLLAVGRLAARKGHALLMRSMRIIVDKFPNAKLVIVGRGRLKSPLLRRARRLGLESSVKILPSLPFEDLSKLHRAVDLVIYPSLYEGQGLVPIESMASSVPVIGFDEGPIPEMITPEVGGLAPFPDPVALGKIAIELLSNPDLLAEMGKAGRALVESKFTYEYNALLFESIYQEAIKK